MSKRPLNSDDDLDLENVFDVDDTGDHGSDPQDDISDGYSEDHRQDFGGGVIAFNGRKYAVGLTWLTVSDVEEQAAITKRAKMINADFFCNRAFVSQTGFGYLKQKHRMGMASAAAMAADILVGEWHGVFSAENGWLYVAVHADTIAPNGDLFFETEEEAYNHFAKEAEKFKWPKTYVPDAWNFKDNDGEIPLDKILTDVSTTSLKPVNLDALFSGKANKNVVLTAGFILVALLVLSLSFQSILTDLIPQKAEVNRPQLQVSDILSIPPKEPVKKENPLLLAIENFSLPRPDKFVQSCMDNFSDLFIPLPGWNLSIMRCRSNFVEALWQQGSGGSLDGLRPYIRQFPFGVNTTYGSRGDFLASKVIGNLSQFNERLELAKREEILLLLNNRFGEIGVLDVKDIVPLSQERNTNSRRRGSRRLASNQNAENEGNDDNITIQDLPSLGVIMKTQSLPLTIKEYFNIPGLRFNAVEWNLNNRNWTFDMQIYLSPGDLKIRSNL